MMQRWPSKSVWGLLSANSPLRQFCTTLALLQPRQGGRGFQRNQGYGGQQRGGRNGYNDRGGRGGGGGGGGNRYGNRGSSNDDYGSQNRRGGNDFDYQRDNRGDGFDNRGRGRGFGRGGFGNNSRDNQYNDNQGRGGGRGRGRGGGRGRGRGGDRDQRRDNDGQQRGFGRGSENFTSQHAAELVDMKSQYKRATNNRDRHTIAREARQLIRRLSLDPSIQDEKSVIILLNSATTFGCSRAESVEHAAQWCLQNLDALSPQNLALFSNALGALDLPDAERILLERVSPEVNNKFAQMNSVEIVMILQAFQRERLQGNESLQDAMLQKLAPLIPDMPNNQLSTLSSVLAHNSLKTRNPDEWKRLVDAVLSKTMAAIEKTHSKEVITFLVAAPYLPVSQDDLVALMKRATDTVGFHTDDHIGTILQAIAATKKEVKEPQEKLTDSMKLLESALLERLTKVTNFVTVRTAAIIWAASHQANIVLPEAIRLQMLEAVKNDLTYRRQRFKQLAAFCDAVKEEKLPSPDLIYLISDLCVGIRPPRPQNSSNEEGDDGSGDAQYAANFEVVYAKNFGHLVRLRCALETIFSRNGGKPNQNLKIELPRQLEKAVEEASPSQLLLAVEAIALAPAGCSERNAQNDKILMEKIMWRLKNDPNSFKEGISASFFTRLEESLKDVPKVKGFMETLAKSMK